MKKLLLASTTFLFTCAMHAQGLPTAPLSTPLLGEHKVFLANASSANLGRFEKLMSQIVYADLYNSLTAKGPSHPVLAPADSDLSLEVSEIASQEVFNGHTVGPNLLRVEIRETKSHALLWVLQESIEGAFREKTFEKNAQTTVDALMLSLASLSADKIPADANTAKYEK